jgi:hypothetical protein
LPHCFLLFRLEGICTSLSYSPPLLSPGTVISVAIWPSFLPKKQQSIGKQMMANFSPGSKKICKSFFVPVLILSLYFPCAQFNLRWKSAGGCYLSCVNFLPENRGKCCEELATLALKGLASVSLRLLTRKLQERVHSAEHSTILGKHYDSKPSNSVSVYCILVSFIYSLHNS